MKQIHQAKRVNLTKNKKTKKQYLYRLSITEKKKWL